MTSLSNKVVCVARDRNGDKHLFAYDPNIVKDGWQKVEGSSVIYIADFIEGLPDDTHLSWQNSKFYYYAEDDKWSKKKFKKIVLSDKNILTKKDILDLAKNMSSSLNKR